MSNGWNRMERAAEKGPMSMFWYIFVRVLLITIVFGVLGGVYGIYRFATNPVRQAARIVEKTIDADNVIGNYEWFKQIAEDLDAADKRVQITEQAFIDFKKDMGDTPRKEWSFEDKEQYGRLTTDLRGQKAHLEQMKADFRARSKMANRAIFKGDSKIIRWVDELAGVAE